MPVNTRESAAGNRRQAGRGGAAGVTRDFLKVCGHFLTVGGDFPDATGDFSTANPDFQAACGGGANLNASGASVGGDCAIAAGS